MKDLHSRNHGVAKKDTVFVNMFSIAPEVVSVGANPVKEMRVVIDAAAHVAETGIESLAVWHRCGSVAEVPFADVARCVASAF